MKKRFVAAVLTLCLALMLLPVSALAANGESLPEKTGVLLEFSANETKTFTFVPQSAGLYVFSFIGTDYLDNQDLGSNSEYFQITNSSDTPLRSIYACGTESNYNNWDNSSFATSTNNYIVNLEQDATYTIQYKNPKNESDQLVVVASPVQCYETSSVTIPGTTTIMRNGNYNSYDYVDGSGLLSGSQTYTNYLSCGILHIKIDSDGWYSFSSEDGYGTVGFYTTELQPIDACNYEMNYSDDSEEYKRPASIYLRAGEYILCVDDLAYLQASEDMEFKGTKSSFLSVTVHTPALINIVGRETEDYVTFTPTQTDVYTFDATVYEIDTWSISALTLYASDASVICSQENSGSVSDFEVSLTANLSSGATYYLGISGYGQGSVSVSAQSEPVQKEYAQITGFYPEDKKLFDLDTPSNGTSSVNYADGKLRIFFDREVAGISGRAQLDFSVGTLSIYRASDDQLIYQVEESAFTEGISTSVALWSVDNSPTAVRLEDAATMLDYDTEYYVTMPAGFIKFTDGTASPELVEGDWWFYTGDSIRDTSARYSLCYDLNGGSGAVPNIRLYHAGDSFRVTSSIPTRNGYTFAGWTYWEGALATTITLQAGDTYPMPQKSCSLVAQWTKNPEPVTPEMKYVQVLTERSLENADETTRETIQNAIYNLLFQAQFRPTEGPAIDGITPEFTGTQSENAMWHPQNDDTQKASVTDAVLGKVSWSDAAAGCMSYANFATAYTYGTAGSGTNYTESWTVEGVRAFIEAHADPGERMSYGHKNAEGYHGIVFLGEDEAASGFYYISYGGGSYKKKNQIDHSLKVKYTTYSAFVNTTARSLGVRDVNGGSYYSGTAKTAAAVRAKAGANSIVIRINCPVEATVCLGDEVLDSRNATSSTSFGTVRRIGDGILFEIDYHDDYELTITGTGEGAMNLSLEYETEDGTTINSRNFEKVPIRENLEIISSAFDPIGVFALYIDSDTDDEQIWGVGVDETADAPGEIYSSKNYAPETDPVNTYTITFDTNDGIVKTETMTTGADGKLPSLPAPTRKGYTFTGWYTAREGGTQVTTNTVFDADTTVFAHWTPNSSESTDSSTTPSAPTYAVTAPSNVKNGTVSINRKNASKGTTVTITVTPDEGYELDELTVTDKNGDALKLTDKGDGRYTFTMPASRVTISASFTEITQENEPKPTEWSTPYIDVPEGVWYYDAVKYVTEHGLMGGAGSDATFQPAMTTTRGMIMTILARMNGVNTEGGSVWYEKGMEWAASTGVSDGSSPERVITRQELVTMLWRYAGEPVSSQSLSGYPDADKTAYWAEDAMQWAVENGIIIHTGEGLLNPTGTATRAEVATILMRFCEKIVNK